MHCVCGQENPEDSRFCVACGGSLSREKPALQSDAPQTIPAAPRAVSVPVAREAASVASQATAAQPAPESPEASSSPIQSRGFLWKWLVLAVLAAAAVGAYFWLNRPQPAYKPKTSGLYPVSVDGKWGYIDRTGAMVIPATFDTAEDFSEGLAAVISQDKYGYIDVHGVLKIPYQFDQVSEFVNGLAVVKLCCGRNPSPNDQWGFIDTKGKYVINPQFTFAMPFFGDLAPVQQGGQFWGFINRKGKFVIPATFAGAGVVTERLARVSQNGRWGFTDTEGKFVINPQFELAMSFSEGLAAVRAGGKWGFIDHSGQYAINPQFETIIHPFDNGAAVVSESGKTAIIDKNGKFLINPGQFTAMSEIVDGQIGVSTPNGAGVIDKSGNWILPSNPVLRSVEPLGSGVYRVQIADDSCFMDQSGNIIYGRFRGQSLSSIAVGIESEKQAIAALKTLNTAQLSYASTYPTAGFADRLSKLGPPPAGSSASDEHGGFVDGELANGSKNGYQLSVEAQARDGIVSQYSITATPTTFSAGNVYCTDATGAVRFTKSGEACNTNSPVAQ